jgi:hypothetical protein
MTHSELCQRAVRWLRNTKRCNPVFSGNASCTEIPDAIGWSAYGSIVVECKTTILDFLADGEKYVRYTRPSWHSSIKGNGRKRQLEEAGYDKHTIPNMGDYRFFLCEPGVIEKAHMEKYPDHGLIHVVGRRIAIVLDARRRESVNLRGEIRYLRFAIVNRYCHTQHAAMETPREEPPSLFSNLAEPPVAPVNE